MKKRGYGNIGLWGIAPLSKKQKARLVIDRNRRRGKIGEDMVRTRYIMRGYEVERTGRGHDFKVRKRDPFTGRVIETKYVEVKTGNAKLSKLQEETKNKKRNYKVERVKPFFW